MMRRTTVLPSKRPLVIVLLAAISATGLGGILFSNASADDLGKPGRNDRVVSGIVARMMTQQHLSKRPLDDTISSRAFDLYIKNLDPTKSYFLKSDINEFSQWKLDLDDQMKAGQFSAAFGVFRRFLQRVDQRTEMIMELIDAEHDFSVDEDMVTDPDLRDFPANEDEARENWRKRIKYNLLLLRGDKKEDAEDANKENEDEKSETDSPKKKPDDPKTQLRKRYRTLARRMHQIDAEDVVERYITSITNSFDPHTSYLSRRSFENFLIVIGLELNGIGATLQASDDGYTVIKKLVVGGAAAKQGDLKVEDKIVAVGQGDEDGNGAWEDLTEKHGTDFVDVTGMKLDEVVDMIRGEAGTTVRLSVISENESELHTVTIVREKIKLEDSAAHGKIFEDGKKADGTANKIGVIDLPSFYANMSGGGQGRRTTTDVRRILEDFNQQDVDAVVLDLRANGGGSLQEAIDCTGLFIDEGPVVQVKTPFGRIQELNDEDSGMAWDGPLVVLTSKFSASASEILAGAVQDYNRGIVVGDTTTHGKGTVQTLKNLDQIISPFGNPRNTLGALKITTQQFYRPNGDSTQKRGVLSDLVLPSITDKMDVSESDLDYPVEFDRIRRAAYQVFASSQEKIKEELQRRSQKRLDQSEKFQEQIRKIKKYVEQKNQKSVSLNEEVFLARRKELSAEKEDEKAVEEQLLPSGDIKRTYYLDEVFRITSDYIELLGKNS